MFESFPTSKAISIKFTLYVVTIMGVFGFFANIIFFQQRYVAENNKLALPRSFSTVLNIHDTQARPGGRMHKFVRSPVETIPSTPELVEVIQQGRIFSNIARIDDEYIVYVLEPHVIKLSVVTRLMQAQKAMAFITLVLLGGLSLLTYRMSKYFVKSSLQRLQRLSAYVDTVTLNTLSTPVPLEGPATDEVRKIAAVLQNSLSTIKRQTDSLQDFISNASHELKTPLMQLSSAVDYLSKANTIDVEIVHSMKKTIKAMNTLTEELLLITKLESMTDHTPVSPINISVALTHLVDTYEPLFLQKGIAVDRSIASDCQQPILAQHFTSIVTNLLSNALKYTETGSVSVTLTADSLRIEDTGIGIHAQNLASIRDKFRQEDAARTSEESHGLGLYLVQKLVSLYGRTITVTSTVGVGTTFTIIFSSLPGHTKPFG